MNEEYENEEILEEVEDTGFSSYEDLMEARKITFEDIKEHLTGPVISTVIHVVLLAFLGTIIVFKAPEKAKNITVAMKKIEVPKIEPPPPPLEPPEPVEIENPTETPIERPNMEVEVDVQVENISLSTLTDVALPSVLNMKMSNSALSLPVNPGGGGGGAIGGDFFGTGGSGRRFAFLLDFSSSMTPKRLLVMKEHLIKALAAFNGKGEVVVMFFGRACWLPQENASEVVKAWGGKSAIGMETGDIMAKFYPKARWMSPSSHNLAILNKYISRTPNNSGTNWFHPLAAVLQMDPQPDVIFLMTDGGVKSNISSGCIEIVKALNKKITVNTIEFGGKGSGGVLETIAQESKGGTYKGFSDAELTTMAQGIVLPTQFTDNTEFNYNITRGVKKEKEEKVKGLTIE